MGSIVDFPRAIIGGLLLTVYEGSMALGSTDLAGVFADVVEGALGSLFSDS